MKTYKLNNVEVSEDQVRELIKSNPELLEKKEVKGRYYFPEKKGETVFIFSNYGTVITEFFNNLLETGAFKTIVDAKLAYDKQCAIVRCWKWAQENAPFEPDWENGTQPKWFAFYSYIHDEIKFEDYRGAKFEFTLPYFESGEDCKKFIEANKADLELLFLK